MEISSPSGDVVGGGLFFSTVYKTSYLQLFSFENRLLISDRVQIRSLPVEKRLWGSCQPRFSANCAATTTAQVCRLRPSTPAQAGATGSINTLARDQHLRALATVVRWSDTRCLWQSAVGRALSGATARPDPQLRPRDRVLASGTDRLLAPRLSAPIVHEIDLRPVVALRVAVVHGDALQLGPEAACQHLAIGRVAPGVDPGAEAREPLPSR